jgi:WD40 repeat protein
MRIRIRRFSVLVLSLLYALLYASPVFSFADWPAMALQVQLSKRWVTASKAQEPHWFDTISLFLKRQGQHMSTEQRKTGMKAIAIEKTRLIEKDFEVNSLSWSADGKYLATTGILTKAINIWDVNEGKVIRTLKSDLPGHAFNALAYSPDGRYLAACQGSSANKTRVWDPASGNIVTDVGEYGPGSCEAIAFSPQGQFLAIAYQRNDTKDLERLFSVAFWDTKTWQLVKRWITPALYVERIAFSPDGRFLAVGGHRATATFPQGVIEIWDVARDTKVKGVIVHTSRNVESLTYSADGKFIASGTSTGEGMSVVDPKTNERIHATNEKAIQIWNVSSGSIVTAMSTDTLKGTFVEGLAYSADGKYLISGSRDAVVRIWNTANHELLQALEAPNHVSSVAVRPDGAMVAASSGKIVTIWELRQ